MMFSPPLIVLSASCLLTTNIETYKVPPSKWLIIGMRLYDGREVTTSFVNLSIECNVYHKQEKTVALPKIYKNKLSGQFTLHGIHQRL